MAHRGPALLGLHFFAMLRRCVCPLSHPREMSVRSSTGLSPTPTTTFAQASSLRPRHQTFAQASSLRPRPRRPFPDPPPRWRHLGNGITPNSGQASSLPPRPRRPFPDPHPPMKVSWKRHHYTTGVCPHQGGSRPDPEKRPAGLLTHTPPAKITKNRRRADSAGDPRH
jgi:hypothetical protein